MKEKKPRIIRRELRIMIKSIRVRGDILRRGDTLLMLGVLHRVTHPMGYQYIPGSDLFETTSIRAMEEETLKKVDEYVNMLHRTAADFKDLGLSILHR
ncbi:hypothetical protein PTKIN_Ptkin01aG0015700 [Pterospermum kingtungense]